MARDKYNVSYQLLYIVITQIIGGIQDSLSDMGFNRAGENANIQFFKKKKQPKMNLIEKLWAEMGHY